MTSAQIKTAADSERNSQDKVIGQPKGFERAALWDMWHNQTLKPVKLYVHVNHTSVGIF